MSAGSRRWGWHQLDASWADRLVAEAGVRPELVLDVGAGTGAVTAALVAVGARVVAVELHRGRARALRSQFPTREVTVVEADATRLRLPRRPFRVVANPPYAITSPLLRRLLQPGSRLVTADLVLQRQAAQRWTSADAPGYRRWAKEFDVRLGLADPPLGVPPLPRGGSRRARHQTPWNAPDHVIEARSAG